MIKILHTGDLHLDSPFAGHSAEMAKQRRRELRETFSAMMTYARSAAVDMVLIAGDLFDRKFATSDTVELLREEFSSLGCPVVIAPGNHDPADGRGIWHSENLPENVHVFTDETLSKFSFDEKGIDVYGFAFTSPEMTSSPISGEFVKDRSRVSILLCHGDITSPISRNCPISAAQIEAFGADYTALGHIHNGEAYSGSAGGYTYAYCGCPEGRDFGECGPKGAIIAEIDDMRHVTITRRTFCRRRYEDIAVSVDGAAVMSEVIRAAETAAMTADERTILRLTFTGTTSPELEIDPSAIKAALSSVGDVTVRDKTTPSLSFSQDDPTVRGEFCRLLLPMLNSSDPADRERAVLALRMGLCALSGNDIV